MLMSPYALVYCYQVAALSQTAFGGNERKMDVTRGIVLTRGIFSFFRAHKQTSRDSILGVLTEVPAHPWKGIVVLCHSMLLNLS